MYENGYLVLETSNNPSKYAVEALGISNNTGNTVFWFAGRICVRVRPGGDEEEVLEAYRRARTVQQASAKRGIAHAKSKGHAISWTMAGTKVRIEPTDSLLHVLDAFRWAKLCQLKIWEDNGS